MSNDYTRRNINRVAELEAQFEQRRRHVERILARVATWVGSLPFMAFHILWFLAWTLLNAGQRPAWGFDPYPFPLLGTIVSCEAVILSTIVLIEQNWAARRDERREHLHLQVNLLAEQEITKVLELQRLICKRLGIREAEVDPEVMAMSQSTEVEALAEELGDIFREG